MPSDSIAVSRGNGNWHRPFYRLELSGSSRKRGEQHGHALREPIERAVDFYRGFFRQYLGISAQEVRRRAGRFAEPTSRTNPLLMHEFEGIAAGSGQSLEDILALSGRYEITFETKRLGECSNVYVGPRRSREGHTLLGQNWEWRPEVLDFRVLLVAHCDDLPDHLMISECGQPGKYGFNDRGLGVAETGLCCDRIRSVGDDLFVVVIRQMLAQTSFDAARDVLYRHPPEATISFVLADDAGHAVNLEAAPDGIFERPLDGDALYWHTNHCLLAADGCTFEDSLIRGRRWSELTAAAESVDSAVLRSWLADSQGEFHSICKEPDPSQAGSATWLQTLCSIVMDLNERSMWVSDGPSSRYGYQLFSLPSRASQSLGAGAGKGQEQPL